MYLLEKLIEHSLPFIDAHTYTCQYILMKFLYMQGLHKKWKLLVLQITQSTQPIRVAGVKQVAQWATSQNNRLL